MWIDPVAPSVIQWRNRDRALLLEHSTNMDAANKDGETPLHLASCLRSAKIVHLLLDRGANANAESKYGWTPLHSASARGNIETMRVLLDRGARADVRNEAGKTPLEVGLKLVEREIAEMLKEHGDQTVDKHSNV